MPLPPAAAAAAGRHGVVSPDDRGPVVQIVAWIFMVAMVLFTATRLAVRYISAHTPGLDDWIVLAAMFLGVGVVIALSLAVNDGLGKRMPGRLAAVEKHVYSATILYLLTLCLAKLSVIVFLARLAAAKTHLAATWALGALTLAWALASVLGFAFRCAMPAPWTFDESCCFDSIAFWKASAAVDMLTDAAMVLLPICILWRIRVAFRKKCLVVSLFALRFLSVCPLTPPIRNKTKQIPNTAPRATALSPPPLSACTTFCTRRILPARRPTTTHHHNLPLLLQRLTHTQTQTQPPPSTSSPPS
ncbi:uncharacterized protein K452DRAFT_288545 [Aplosporella prunicola CBS 121167]|uniref:Rhodopsin domain-containing protein n=1 Tax=Aplosporella prunicola CBS 121167 TaxID=1176127 RepID=A0A6A6BAS6_9PEZI|nr:uncharacterized protein K452DRAFT_288545 [Aplosporella prunicola CBS 121167]KAF2140463.1 hypothetical protein K452DRAFT_288545 [Aplosporella prunicola CBS 121167]